MHKYYNQLTRIKSKLGQAKKVDNKLEVFGTDSHKYKLNPVITQKELEEFELIHNIRLPEDFRLFLTELGNGGAGPYYGIYPLKNQYAPSKTGLDCVYHPEMTDDEWNELYDLDDMEIDGQLSEWDEKTCRGNLSLGTQGCMTDISLVVSGKNKGLVYYDIEDEKPFFVFESNFLDWYERWLDEIIAGYNLASFGIRIAGDESTLIKLYGSSEDFDTRLQAIKGFIKLKTLSEENLNFLIDVVKSENNDIGLEALFYLAKHSYQDAIPYLKSKLQSRNEEAILLVAQCIHHFANDTADYWAKDLCSQLKFINKKRPLDFINYVITKSSYNYFEDIFPFVKHESAGVRKTTMHILSQYKGDKNYEVKFIECLKSDDTEVIRSALLNIKGVKSQEIIPLLERALNMPDAEKSSLYSFVENRTNELGFIIVESNGVYSIVPKPPKSFIKKLIGIK